MAASGECTLFVFRDATDARQFNDAIPASYESVHRFPEFPFHRFRILPFALNPPPTQTPPPGQILHEFREYPPAQAVVLFGIDWILQAGGVDVLSLSLAPPGSAFDSRDPWQIATHTAHEMGIPVVVAAGNDGPAEGSLQPLAQAPWVISVGAVESTSELAEVSSRGWRCGPLPTVVADGYPELTVVDVDRPAPIPFGTSFAAPQVARVVLLLSKVFEVIQGNLVDAGTSFWGDQSRPFKLPLFGIPDTGMDPRVLPERPEHIAKALENGIEHFSVPRTEHEKKWCEALKQAILSWGLVLDLEKPLFGSPDAVKGALKAIAQPIPDREPWEVGFGFVSDAVARGYLLNLTPSRFVRTIDPEHEHNRPGYILTDLRRLDDEFGPLWDSSQLSLLHTCFHDCIRLKIAKVT